MARVIKTDILIVGAGPVGLTLAIVLAKYGLNFKIIEKDDASTTQDRAISITSRTLEYLDLINIAQNLIQCGIRCYETQFYYKSHKITQTDFRPIPSQFNFILQISQPSILRILNEELERLGVKVGRPIEFVESHQDSDGITCSVTDKSNDESYQIECKYLVACDGSRSTIRTQSGAKFVGYVPDETTIIADMALSHFPLAYEYRHYVLLPDHAVFFVLPMERIQNENVSRVILTQRGQHSYGDEAQIVNKLKSVINKLGYTDTEYSSPKWTTNFNPKQFVIESFFHNNVIYLGDAAHIQSPIGAQGLNTGIQDVFNLAWKLLFVQNHHYKTDLLNTYHIERHPIAEKLLKYNESVSHKIYNTSLFSRLVQLIIKKLSFLSYFKNKEIGQISQINVFYPKPIDKTHENKQLLPGHRMPDIVFDSATLSHLYALTQVDKFLFVIFDNGEDITAIIDVVRPYHKYAKTLIISKNHSDFRKHNFCLIQDKNNHLHEQYHIKSKVLCLVRPDNYIGTVLTHDIANANIDHYFNETIYQ